MQPNKKPWWAQATALVSVTASGAVTGLTFAPGTPAQISAPTSLPVHLLALEKSAQATTNDDALLRAAIVNVAKHYLRLAQTRTPAEMEALIWGKDSVDGADHGASCAAFASLTLELAAQAVGQQSWVTGGSTYPWPLHEWADVRVDPNPASLGIISVLQDAQANHRWHALGEGYVPQPGDWVLFDGHVEVITGYADGVLETIGGDSLPNYSVNAHTYDGSLDSYGIQGFVNNGSLPTSGDTTPAPDATPSHHHTSTPRSTHSQEPTPSPGSEGSPGSAALPGAALPSPASSPSARSASAHSASTRSASAPASERPSATRPPDHTSASHTGEAAIPEGDVGSVPRTSAAQASIPGTSAGPTITPAPVPAAKPKPKSKPPTVNHAHAHAYSKADPGSVQTPTASAQHAFISQIAPGAMATQREYGVPAAVTIAQAIDESGWGQSELALKAYNLFGIQGTGPAGSVTMPTQEYENGTWVTVNSAFRAYHDYAESIADHGRLLATDSAYQHAMADRGIPDAFAADLAGVYATNPGYGGQLVAIMRLYDLYRFDVPSVPAAHAAHTAPASPHAATPHAPALHAPAGRAPRPHAPVPLAAPTPDVPGIPGTSPNPRTQVEHAATNSSSVAGSPSVPGVPGAAATSTAAASSGGSASIPAPTISPATTTPRGGTQIPGASSAPAATFATARVTRHPYRQRLPLPVATAFLTSAKVPLTRNEGLYQDVAEIACVPWELLAACDWLQCEARQGYSPVHGEKLGKTNRDGTVYHTKSEALGQCAADLIGLSAAVYGIDVTVPRPLSVHDLANVFAAFRWGGLLRRHGISAMEFPYSVAGLTLEHTKMSWPRIPDAHAPDKPGTRFRGAFGAVPILLSLKYPATV